MPGAPSKKAEAQSTPAPSVRPGLATAWGEEVASQTHRDTTFTRPDQPFSISAINYNDRRGVDALIAHQGAQNVSRMRKLTTTDGVMSFAIHDESDQPRELVRVGDKTYVVGGSGERYSLVVTNHTAFRIVAVASVDGLDVVSGQPGTPKSLGYIVEPFRSMHIQGFRKSAEAVAAFRFSSVAESYAAQTGSGSTRNVGVIGFALVAQKGERPVPPSALETDTRNRDSANPFPASKP